MAAPRATQRRSPDPNSVFLNVPFDRRYESLFVTLVGTLVSLGRTPRSVLEISESGEERLERIQGLLEKCRVSIHDLSRVGIKGGVRFNMPFELGLACSLRRYAGHHDFVVLEAQRHRVDRTLSDLRGIDPGVHGNRVGGMMVCVRDRLGVTGQEPKRHDVEWVRRRLRRVATRIKDEEGQYTIFHRGTYLQLVYAATELASSRGLIHAA
jgi:hypothetical protein